MNIGKILFIMLALGFVVALPRPTSAASIGASPGTMDVTIYQGDTFHQIISLSRSENMGEMRFDVSTDSSQIVNFNGLTEAVIADGEQSVLFPFDVIAGESSLGDYDAKITFQIKKDQDASGAGGTSLIYGVSPIIHVHVLARPDPSVTLNANQYPPALDSIDISDQKLVVTRAPNGHMIHVSWTVQNNGLNPIEQIPTRISINQHGRNYVEKFLVSSVRVPSNASASDGYDYLVPDADPGGTYNVTVSVGDEGTNGSVWILQTNFRKQLKVVFVGILLAIAVAAILLAWDRHRVRLGRRNH